MKYTGSSAQGQERNKTELDRCIALYTEPDNNFWVWAVIEKQQGQFVGTCAIVGKDHELGYRLLEKHWRKGYGREISDALVEHAFRTMKLEQVFCSRLISTTGLPSKSLSIQN